VGAELSISSVWSRWRNGWENRSGDEFWALRDVSFEVAPGEVLGIIGRNGAGKSTILKILGRITRPTRGRATVRGRLGTLLEVGTGFHPELSGRENIYLSGSILGMTHREISRKFDDIVEFSEIKPFLAMPVKRYSSGMYVRLAFAVAAHLEPEILAIDEVLAVGDLAFQRKCLSRMETLSGHNRTILFVSHNLGAIRQLCPRSILIDHGRLVQDGPTPDVLRTYNELLRNITVDSETGLADRLNRTTGAVRFTELRLENVSGEREWDFQTGETIRVRFSYQVFEPVADLRFYFALRSTMGGEIVTTVTEDLSRQPLRAGTTGSCILELPENVLRPGDYPPFFWLGSVAGVGYDNLDAQNASFPPLTIWSDATDPHRTVGFFSMPARLIHVSDSVPGQTD
jgi:lipopolysaccharide transport system ATP-binding protein